MTEKTTLIPRAIVGAALDHSIDAQNLPLSLESAQESNWTPASLEKAGLSLKALSRMAKRPPVNVFFEDISYTVSSRKGLRTILNNVSGEFRSGELTCILGPSGAGKSSLLNVIAGYSLNGVNGRVLVNGHNRDMKVFKKLSCYIMQDDLLQPNLSVLEAMSIAADLKLGKELGRAEKDLILEEILKTLYLWDHRNTECERLSGGQYKRLSIALELVNNPPIVLLDEPTSGLDVVSIRQLVVLLRLLSRQGRTIVCSMHQPSASLFALFDRVYVIAQGMCCYQGAATLVVPFLAEAGYICPTTYNPADFILETLASEALSPEKLSVLSQNGKLCRKLDGIKPKKGRKSEFHSDDSISRILGEHVVIEQLQKVEFPTTFFTQFLILTKRMLVQKRRNTVSLWIQFVHHFLMAIITGGIFYMVGNNASTPIVNFKFCVYCLVFITYTYAMIPILLFPTEIRILRREYYNRWYSLKAYYTALTVTTLPAMFVFCMSFTTICYIMSGQILEWDRFLLFSWIGLLTAVCSEGFGLIIGSTFSATNGSIIGPAIAAPLLAVCCYGMGFGPTIEENMKILMGLSFMRYSATGMSLALYQNRKLMECKDIFCLYSNPDLILRDVGMINERYYVQVIGLIIFTVLHRTMAFLALRYRLTTEFSNRFMIYVSKFLKHR